MFGEILKQKRIELQLTQQAMADQLFVTRQNISNWENGKNYPDIPTLIRISEDYDLSLDYLLKGDSGYVKKVENDYQLINRKRRKTILQNALGILLFTIVILVGIFSMDPSIDENLGEAIILGLSIPLVIVSFALDMEWYPEEQYPKRMLFLPKVFGFGIAVNPRHPVGKLIWVSILLLLVYLLSATLIKVVN